ncbi:hypothetical protein IWQ56_005780 [Coemansia nantahalensis]|uniref:Uncharacterized protein n=1 Tax=Coemansia helicoidea TaxID=1286919 RepID=A0ACC1LCK0_9FUNG|nr:hypothetical protein IWQ56_005780 [Coemansia nantahalensis]KAJ2805960.1 hypothetical protein H4R21_001064 [Coemansia helicoidea]
MGAATAIVDYDYGSRQVREHTEEVSAKEFVRGGGAGIYTSMRTVGGGRRVFLFDDHLQRIVDSHRLVLADSAGPAVTNDTRHWAALLRPLLRRGLALVRAGGGGDGETKITVLVGAAGVRVQFVPLQPVTPAEAACWVRLVSGRREHPTAKSLEWARAREHLEQLIVPPINDVVLVEDASCADAPVFYEGTSSNFFAVRRVAHGRSPEYRNFELLAAPRDSVLLGTIMRLVLRICDRDGVAVVHGARAPMDAWAGAFISSTSRLVLPVERVVYGANAEHWWPLDGANALVAHLRDSVLGMAVEQSAEI